MSRDVIWVPEPPIFTEEVDLQLSIWETHTIPSVAQLALKQLPEIRREFVVPVEHSSMNRLKPLINAALGFGTGAFVASLFTSESVTSSTPLIVGGLCAVALGGNTISNLADSRHYHESEERRMQWRAEILDDIERTLRGVVNPDEGMFKA